MADFKIKIAGHTAQVHSLFESTRDYCRHYLSQENPVFSLKITRDDLEFEQRFSEEEAHQEGFRLRKFPEPFLERASIQRKIAEHLFDHDILLFHGSAVAVDGEGYLFTAKSGTGKSTHTRLWREVLGHRAVMVNDDKPFLQLTDHGVLICGSPWSGKHGLDTNITVPLKGLCILQRGSENRIRPAAPAEALPRLLHETILPLAPHRQSRFPALVTALSEKVPLWHMECTKGPQAAILAYEAMSAKHM